MHRSPSELQGHIILCGSPDSFADFATTLHAVRCRVGRAGAERDQSLLLELFWQSWQNVCLRIDCTTQVATLFLNLLVCTISVRRKFATISMHH